MDAMMIMMAKIMPKEMIINKLEQEIQAYKTAVISNDKQAIEKAENGILVNSLIFVTKEMTEGQDLGETLKEMEHAKNVSDIMSRGDKTPKNSN